MSQKQSQGQGKPEVTGNDAPGPEVPEYPEVVVDFNPSGSEQGQSQTQAKPKSSKSDPDQSDDDS